MSSQDVTIDANTFLTICLQIFPEGVLSLGWKVDLAVGQGDGASWPERLNIQKSEKN